MIWKKGMEDKGLRVNMGKTKIMVSGPQMDSLRETGKHPCAICLSGTGQNSIYCSGCAKWVHKKCSNIKGSLKQDSSYKCPRCQGTARPIDGRPIQEAKIGEDTLEVVAEFCYLGDMLSAGGDCELAAIKRCKAAWGKFRELLPLLTNRHLPLTTRGRVYSACIRSVMLYGTETWATSASTLHRLRRNDRAMMRWICRVKPEDQVSSDLILTRLGIRDIGDVLRTGRLRWLGHVERSNSWIAGVRKIEVEHTKTKGRPKLSWDEVVARDRASLGMRQTNPQDRQAWRGRLRRRLDNQAAPS